MPPPQRPQRATGYGDLDWVLTDDGSRTLFDRHLNETYHSGCGAVAETLVVYLWHSGLLERLRSGQACAVFEFGLGTATALLLTAAVAEHYRTPLVYQAVECAVIPPQLLLELELTATVDQALASGNIRPTAGTDPQYLAREFQPLGQLINRLSGFLNELPSGGELSAAKFLLHHVPLSEFVQFELCQADALSPAMQTHLAGVSSRFDAVYFDPFSPETNPQLWTPLVYQQANRLLKDSGRLVSYCVKGSVRRDLASVGFEVSKVPGPLKGKREVLCAVKQSGHRTQSPCNYPSPTR